METLEQQLTALIQEAPNDGITASLVQRIAPLLQQTAGQLKHPQYHVLQGSNEGWIVTTLSNRTQPELEKSVIYAFPTAEDAQARMPINQASKTTVSCVPVVHILFQLIALKSVESVIFFEKPGRLNSGIEISCSDFRHQVRAILAAHQTQRHSHHRKMSSPDIA